MWPTALHMLLQVMHGEASTSPPDAFGGLMRPPTAGTENQGSDSPDATGLMSLSPAVLDGASDRANAILSESVPTMTGAPYCALALQHLIDDSFVAVSLGMRWTKGVT